MRLRFWLWIGLAAACASAAPDLPVLRGDPPPDQRVAVELFRRLDLDRPELAPCVARLRERDLAGALAIWRDGAVRRLRAIDFGEYGWHSYKGHPRPVALARYYAGTATPAEVQQWHPKLAGSDGTVARIRSGNFEEPLPSLVHCFHQTQDPVYLRRAMALMADFCATSQPEFWQWYQATLAAGELPTKPPVVDWRINTNGLENGWRLKNLMLTLAGLAKGLGDDRAKAWADVLKPLTGPCDASLIDPVQLAQIAMSGYEHHAPWVLWFGLRSGAVPNQRSTSLRALLMLNLVFCDFQPAPAIAELLDQAFVDLLDHNFLPDGGSLEQSFNYNAEDMQGLREVLALFGEDRPPWAAEMQARIAAREQVSLALTCPLRGLPQVGNSHAVLGRDVWSSPEAAQRYLQSANPGAATAAQPQPYQSVQFPYSGFYALRDGWELKDRYLFLFNGRSHTGHTMAGRNSIQITAYGRQLVVCGGPPTYGFRNTPDAAGADAYLSEDSTWKTSTVAVDGQSQARAEPVWGVAPQTPIPARFHTSDQFDLVDGRFDAGYVARDPKDRQIERDVAHERTVAYVRAAKLWVVVDSLLATDDTPHRYTQIWKLPPRVKVERQDQCVDGFTPEQVTLDAAARRCGTTDPRGPNLTFHHFGPPAIEYRQYCGDRERWLGWHARGIGDAVPAVDLHVEWPSTASPTLVTLLVPTDVGQASPMVSSTPLDDPATGVAGFDARLADGSRLAAVAAAAPRELAIGEYRTAATLLLLHERDGQVGGLVRGGTSLRAGGATLACDAAGFEFRRTAAGWRTTPIFLPQTPTLTPEPQPVLAMADHPPVTIETIPGLVTRYTTDGAEPTAASPAVAGPVKLTAPTTVKARFFRDGQPLPLVATRHYRPYRWSLRPPDRASAAGLVNGLRYRYAKRPSWSRDYDLMKDADFRAQETGVAVSYDHLPTDRLTAGQAAMVFDGYLAVPRDGLYTFHVKCADGVSLFVRDPAREIELPAQAQCPYTTGQGVGSVALRAGWHCLRILYKKSHHGDRASIEVTGPGVPRQPLPAGWLWRER